MLVMEFKLLSPNSKFTLITRQTLNQDSLHLNMVPDRLVEVNTLQEWVEPMEL